MKRLKSSDDLNSYGGEKGVFKDWGRKDDDSSSHQSSSHRSFHYKSESGKKGLSSSSSSRYDRVEDDRKNSRLIRKRPDYDVDSYERRKSYDRYRDSSERGILSSSPRGGYGSDRVHRSESFSGPRRDFPKGFRSERDRSRREGSVSSWRRFSGGKEAEDDGAKSGGDSARGSKTVSEEIGNVRSPQGGRDVKSPNWSKDSGSEQSKSVEVKKSESVPAESGNNSEREEGELEPDHEIHPESAQIVEKTVDDSPSEPLKSSDPEISIVDKCLVSKEEIKPEEKCVLEEKADVQEQEQEQETETLQNVTNMVNNKLSSSEDSSTQRTCENEAAVSLLSDNEKKDANKEESMDVSGSFKLEEIKPEQNNDANIEVKEENENASVNLHVTENAERNDSSNAVDHSLVTKELTQNFKDKGKSVIVSASGENDESSGFLNSKRGFDLFFVDEIKKPVNSDQKGANKPKDEKLSLEPLELSLRLPSVLLPIGAHQPSQSQDSLSQEMSIQSHASSFQTSSDGFTRSFSGSQHYTHNPSCSLTDNNSFDFEQSVGSRPLFGGVNWQIQPSDDHQNIDPPVHQIPVSNGNSNIQSLQLQGVKVTESSYKTPIGLDRQLRSPTQSVGSHENGSGHHKDRKRVISGSGSTDMVEPLLAMMVSDPLHIVTRILNEMPPQSLTTLKESARDLILNPSKRRQFSAFRKALEKRSDINLETLLKSHNLQIQILTALKTGIQDFLQTNPEISSHDLAEIFLNSRCRNLACRSYLPVEECDCKICTHKNGFCSACMCLICSKFDMASNTCSWVGCDVCLHWCHTDCGLKESFIKNGRSANTNLGQSQTEMQFFCVACNHPSEMFGFVREVFQHFAHGWSVESLANEVEYVRRIFSGSEDIRGKRLYEICHQMLTRLSNNKSDVHQVRSYILSFLTDDDGFKSENLEISQEKERVKQTHIEQSNNNNNNNNISNSKSSHEAAMWRKSIYTDRLKTASSDMPPRVTPSFAREPVFDELDGIIKIKLAEAQMFQTRADDARREAEGLNRIAQAKSKKIDEEFASRVTKLHLSEAEEIRRQKFEELQVLENAHQEYFNMKVRMEREIKDLLLKMEATKRNFSS